LNAATERQVCFLTTFRSKEKSNWAVSLFFVPLALTCFVITMKNIIGRHKELKLLNSLKHNDSATFVAVFGRRRVGKTFLIRNAFDNQFTFQLTGLGKGGVKKQLNNFYAAFAKQMPPGVEVPFPKDWFWAFQQLSTWLESLPAGKKTIFLDELPWFDTPQSGFVSALEHFWNSWASARQDILLIVCGSAASWMLHNLINNRGGLHNRVTHRIRLDPFTLAETAAYFAHKSATYEQYQLVQLYMVTGGIPFYLEQVNTGKSIAQNINDLGFLPDGFLRLEFDNLYASLYRNANRHIAVVEALAQKSKGMSREQLLLKAALPDGGSATKVLKELEQSGFIRKYQAYDKKEKNALFQLADFYSLFYLKFIKNTSPLDKNNWISGLDSPEYRAWSGYAFEQVCLSHIDQIKNALGISGVQTATSAWIGEKDGQKAQIDLVIDRRDQVINLCEMKFSTSPFAIDKAYAGVLRNKIGLFKEITGTNKAIFLTMITTFGLAKNEHAMALVQNNLTMEMLFRE
jgi:AAA+ ATPase superfamily predicted ATPase